MGNHLSIGWISTGQNGLPMAVRAVQAGFAVNAFDASAARLALAEQQGLSVAANAAGAGAGKDVVVVSLPDDNALRAVTLGPDGLVAKMKPGAVLIETSTVSAEASAELAAAAAARQVAYLRTPVSGNASIAHT